MLNSITEFGRKGIIWRGEALTSVSLIKDPKHWRKGSARYCRRNERPGCQTNDTRNCEGLCSSRRESRSAGKGRRELIKPRLEASALGSKRPSFLLLFLGFTLSLRDTCGHHGLLALRCVNPITRASRARHPSFGELAEHPKSGTVARQTETGCDLLSMQCGLDVNPRAGNHSDRRRCNG